MLKYLICGVSLAALAVPAAAQDEEPSIILTDVRTGEEFITVTATGTRTEVEDTGQAVTVITENEILDVQGSDLTRVLQRVPGLSLSRNGGLGAFTGVRVRGAEAEQLLVIVDGVRVADPASPSGGFDFGNLLSANLGKLDILRGSNSTIWGSDAIGGVLVASTRAESGLLASAEYGANDSVLATASGGLSDPDTGFLGLSGSFANTDGFSAAETGTEADGFEQWALDGHARYYFSDRLEVFARLRQAEGELEFDGFPAPDFSLADTDEVQDTSQTFGSAGMVYDSGPLFVQGSYSFADTSRDNFNRDFGDDPTFTSDGRSGRIAVNGEWRPIGPLLLNFGAENEWTAYETLFAERASTRIFGTYAQAGVEWRGISGHLGARFTDHDDFGSEVSFGADASYAIASNWRVRASIGEGFKAPSLFQLLSDFGNAALEPEESTSLDLGIAYGDRAQAVYGGVTLFHRETDDQIAFVGCFGVEDTICEDRPFGTYDNIARTRALGVEVEAGVFTLDSLRLGAVYAFTEAEDRDSGNRLPRRPRHAATLTADWQAIGALTLGADLRLVSNSFDNAANTVRLDGYELLTLRAAYELNNMVELYGRVENVWDEDYQTAAGYATRGRAAFVGARLRL
ncbi:TonB-dependent receptor plug domain-containing protein [Aurantiacibacter aquimixticola]|uniref:TonB-dependent receptor plug domain-containing protein n=1 Tax=Aurantiacibacter aquimixticola TaxID=1958945 RepID=UPI001F5B0A76|nr:TonB-dependent receptor [Aurantiacibacter aquimixticola]